MKKEYDLAKMKTRKSPYASKLKKPVRSTRDYSEALKSVEGLMNAKAATSEGDMLDVLVTLMQAYEEKHFPMLPPDPVESIKFMMEQRGLTVCDLTPVFGRANRGLEE